VSTKTTTISDRNRGPSSLERLFKRKQRLRKLWQETRDPACKTAVNWVTETIRKIVRKRALEWWETKTENCEVTPQAIWPIAKSLTKRGEPKATTALHCPLGPVFYPNEKSNVIANYLENLFTTHKVCDTDHERRVEARVHALLTIADENPPVKFRPCEVSKDIRFLKLGKACGIDVIPKECLRHLPRRSIVHLNHFEKLILKTIHRHISERNLLNASQFGFRARHSTTHQCMRLAGHVSLNFNNNMPTAAVFLDIEKAFDIS
jgi:hypothetical protein